MEPPPHSLDVSAATEYTAETISVSTNRFSMSSPVELSIGLWLGCFVANSFLRNLSSLALFVLSRAWSGTQLAP
jgi:hypothetical protein